MDLREEKVAFISQLETLLLEHLGKWVVFKDGLPISFHGTSDEAYRAGLEKFGPGEFLLDQVMTQKKKTISFLLDYRMQRGSEG